MNSILSLLSRLLGGKNAYRLGWLGKQANSLVNTYTHAEMTGAEREANAWSSEEAEKQRAWEEEMRNTSYQAQVRDMQAAGINPAVMYGGTGASGASVPSGAFASSVSPSSSNGIFDIVGPLLDIALLGAQKKNIEADTEGKLAGAERDKAETERTRTLTEPEKERIFSEIRKNNQDISESEARASLAIANAAYVSKETKWYDALTGSQVALNEAYESLADAQTKKNEQDIKESEQRIKNLKQEVVESMARCVVYSANAGYLDQATVNLMEEQGLIEVRRAGVRTEYQINEKILQNYDTDKWFIRSQQAFSALRDAGIAAGSVVSGGLFAPSMPKIGFK